MTRLGQNFLKSKRIARKIIDTAQIKPGDTVLEVGPGKGILTEILLEKAKKVIAVEKDPKLVGYLREKFKDCKNLKLIEGDILKFDNCKLIGNWKLENGNWKIVANIPYYITSRFLKTFLETENQPTSMTLTVQKEVAQRIIAKDGKESILSISVKVYGHPKIIQKVPAVYFSPKPKVDSAIIKISNISHDFFTNQTVRSRTCLAGRQASHSLERGFFALVRRGFAHKRKLLMSNIQSNLDDFNKCGLNPKIRAQELSLEKWKCLYLSKN